jgi:Protein of unknown function (DUF2637)
VSRPSPDIQASAGPAAGHARRVDTGIRAAGVTVAALAGIAGAISYSHMRALAVAHGETGWQAHTFPLSVDGIEIVASLVLLSDRRTGRPSGWLPWAALAAGTTASLAANVAAAGTDLVGRVVAGWPAFALLVAVKLMSQLLEPRRDAGRPVAKESRRVPGRRRPPRPRALERVPGAHADLVSISPSTAANGYQEIYDLSDPLGVPHWTGSKKAGPAGTGTGTGPGAGQGTSCRDGSGKTRRVQPSPGTAVPAGTVPDIAGLLPAARTARDRLLDLGEALTRDALAAQLRRDDHPMRNATVSSLLTALRQESHHSAAGRDHRP